MPDLRSVLRHAADPPPESAFDERAVRTRVRRRRGLRRGAAALPLVALVATVWLAGDLRDPPDLRLADEPGNAAGGWSTLPASPLSPRFGSFAAWSGREFLIWGGYTGSATAADGAAYDPATGVWRSLPDAPLPGLYGGQSAWTGEELWVVGGIGDPNGRESSRAAAAYDPAANAWRRLPEVPALVLDGVWAGDRYVVLTRSDVPDSTVGELWALEPQAAVWRQVGRPAGELPRGAALAANGGEVFVVLPGAPVRVFDVRGASAEDPGRPLPGPPDLSSEAEVDAAWTDEGLLVVGGGGAHMLRDGAWVAVPAPPGTEFPPVLHPLPDGRVVAVDRADTVVSIWDRGAWTPAPDSPLAAPHSAAVAVAGDRLLAWGGASSANQPSAAGAVLALPAPRRVLLFATDAHRLTTVDVERGEQVAQVEVPQLGEGDPPFRLAARGGQLVFYGQNSGDTYAIDPDLGAARLLGTSLYFVPSAHPDRVWLVEGLSTTAVRSVREVAVDGTVTIAETTPPTGTPLLAVNGGLVLATDDGLDVWDAASNQVLRRLPGTFPVAAHGDLVAWCGDPCDELRLTDVGTGAETVVPRPEGVGEFHGFGAAFSPDGRTLAVGVGGTGLVLVDVASGEARPIRGAVVDFELTWTLSGDRLLFSAQDGRIFSVPAQDSTATPTGADVGQVYGLAVLIGE